MAPNTAQRTRPRAEIEAENRYLKRTTIAEQAGAIVQSAFKYGCILGCAYLFKEAVVALSGQNTSATIDILGNLSISNSLALLFGVSGVAYGHNQKKLKEKTIERLSSRNKDLEELIDKNRTSSKLASTGETNPRDKK